MSQSFSPEKIQSNQQNQASKPDLSNSFFIWLLENRFFFLVCFGIIAIYGTFCLQKIKIDAIPDITSKQVIINTKALDIDPVKIEKSITYPIESELYGIPGLKEMRSLSRYGLSQIILTFKDETNINNARSEILQRLLSVSAKLPTGISPTIAPPTTGIGEILIYRVFDPNHENQNSPPNIHQRHLKPEQESDLVYSGGPNDRVDADRSANFKIYQNPKDLGRDAQNASTSLENQHEIDSHSYLSPFLANENLMKLRTIQEFQIARELKKVPGIAEIDTIGGFARELHINTIPRKIAFYGLTEKRIIEQIRGIGESFGGGYIEKDNQQKIVRTEPNLKNFEDLMNVPIKVDYMGRPLTLSQIVEVRAESHQRLGAAIVDGKEAVLGTVLMRTGSQSAEVLSAVKQAIAEFNANSSEAKIEILYDRQFLINGTIKTVIQNLGEGILLVVAVLCVLLGSLRIGLIVASSLIFCAFLLAIFMNLFSISANLMSLGALDFGLLVDSSVVLVEFFLVSFALVLAKNSQEKIKLIASSSSQMLRPIATGIFIITLVYVPILMFSGIEGKTFRPMALNVIIAMLSSLAVAFLLMPILSYFFLPANFEHQSRILIKISAFYQKLLASSLLHGKKIVIASSVFFVASLILVVQMPSDFLPVLNEGDLVFTVQTKDGASLSSTIKQAKEIENEIRKNPAVKRSFVRIGSGESGLDPAPQNMADIFVILRNDQKTKAKKLAESLMEMARKGCKDCEIAQTQPITMRFNEMLEGSRADLALKIFGDDLSVLSKTSAEITKLIINDSSVEEIARDAISSIRTGQFVDVEPDYQKIVRHQIRLEDVNQSLSNSMAGNEVGKFYETIYPISIVLHLSEKHRSSLQSIQNIPVALNDGGSFPLSEVSEIKETEDFVAIPRLFGKRVSSLSIYLKDTNYRDFIARSEKKIAETKILPDGYRLEWSGRFKNFNRAKLQIYQLVPLIILAIFLILRKIFREWRLVLIVFSAVPFAISGGIFLLYFCQIPITISVYVGFIALFGISLLNSIVLLSSLSSQYQSEQRQISLFKVSRKQFIKNLRSICLARLRPILMTATTASLGFLPMAFGHGLGAEVQQPISITVIGGIISSTFATLIITPILMSLTQRSILKGMIKSS